MDDVTKDAAAEDSGYLPQAPESELLEGPPRDVEDIPRAPGGFVRGVSIGMALAILLTAVLGIGATWYGELFSHEGIAYVEESSDREDAAGKLASLELTGLASIAETSPLGLAEIIDAGPDNFSTTTAMAVVKELAALGPRIAGSSAETTAFNLLDDRLQDLGYSVARQTVSIPGGTSQNLIVERPGRSNQVIVLGAHVDSKDPAPGANDNGSGCGVLVALAESLKDVETDATLRFIFFGAEEIVGGNPADHHFGSRHYVASLSTAERQRISGMFSVDMVGVGTQFHIRTMQKGPMSLANDAQDHADLFGYSLTYLRDEASSGLSDHEPFENANLPAALLCWREDPYYHTAKDTYGHVSSARVRTAGEFMAGYLIRLSEDDLKALRQ